MQEFGSFYTNLESTNTDTNPITNMDQTEVLQASVPNQQVPQFILQKLQPLLPYSLPLCRRCQFHLKDVSATKEQRSVPGQPELWIVVARTKPHATSHAKASVDLPAIDGAEWLSAWLTHSRASIVDADPPVEEWLAAHVDLTNPGSTQVCAFASWENGFAEEASKNHLSSKAKTPARVAMFKAFFAYLRAYQIPALPVDPPLGWRTLLSSGKIVSTPYSRNKILFGGLAECLWQYLDDDVVYAKQKSNLNQGDPARPQCIARQDRPYLKYLLDLSPPNATLQKSSAPPGFRFADLSDAQLQLMLDRSVIPRTLKLLQSLVSVGVFADGVSDPVAWGVLSKDASLASLHTEPDYRGRGMAECVARELIRVTSSAFRSNHSRVAEVEEAETSISYAHADVSPANLASRRVFEKMGGKVGWHVAWIEVSVGEGEIDV